MAHAGRVQHCLNLGGSVRVVVRGREVVVGVGRDRRLAVDIIRILEIRHVELVVVYVAHAAAIDPGLLRTVEDRHVGDYDVAVKYHICADEQRDYPLSRAFRYGNLPALGKVHGFVEVCAVPIIEDNPQPDLGARRHVLHVILSTGDDCFGERLLKVQYIRRVFALHGTGPDSTRIPIPVICNTIRCAAFARRAINQIVEVVIVNLSNCIGLRINPAEALEDRRCTPNPVQFARSRQDFTDHIVRRISPRAHKICDTINQFSGQIIGQRFQLSAGCCKILPGGHVIERCQC